MRCDYRADMMFECEGPYFLYGSFVAVGTLVAFVYMPETLGRSLETCVLLSLPLPLSIKPSDLTVNMYIQH